MKILANRKINLKPVAGARVANLNCEQKKGSENGEKNIVGKRMR